MDDLVANLKRIAWSYKATGNQECGEYKYCTEAAAAIEAQAAMLRECVVVMRELLEVQDEPCWTDHHGYCQAHNLDDVNNGGCRVDNGRATLAKAEEMLK